MAEAEVPDTQPPPASRMLDSPCAGVSFPLALEPSSESYLVTKDDDSEEEGSLRWAFTQANEHPGIDEVVVAADLVVRSSGDIEVHEAVILRGENATSEIINVADEAALLVDYDADDEYPFFASSIILSGSPETQDPRGLYLTSDVCAAGFHNVTVRGFADYAIMLGETWPFPLFEIKDSFVTGNRTTDDGYGDGAIELENEGIAGDIRIINTEFRDNDITAFNVTASLESDPDYRSTMLVEGSRFINNRDTPDEERAGALQVNGISADSYEDEEGMPPISGPFLTIRDTLFQGNVGGLVGAVGIDDISFSNDSQIEATMVAIERSTFEDNTSLAQPGGYHGGASDVQIQSSYLDEFPGVTALHVSDSTFQSAADSSVPNIHFDEVDGRHVFDHITLVGNGIAYRDSVEENASFEFTNSVLSTGTRDPLEFDDAPMRSGVAAKAASEDGVPAFSESHMAYTTAPSLVPAGDGRLVGTTADFALGALDASLGLTPVMVPGAGSKLIDAAGPGGSPTDQRGLARPQGAGPDIGAVEVETQPATIEIGDDQTGNAGDTITFDVTRANATENPWTGEATVKVTTHDGTATAGTDYTGIEETLTWADGDTTPKTVTVHTSPGHVGESDVTFTVTLSDPGTNTTLGDRVTANGTIIRDEDGGTVTPPKPDPKPKPEPGKPDTKDPLADSGSGAFAGIAAIGAFLAAAGGAFLWLRRRRDTVA